MQNIKCGDIIHVRGNALFPSKAIRACLGVSWGNHDALVVSFNGRLRVGETSPPFSRLVEIDKYIADLHDKSMAYRVYRVPHATELQRFEAGNWWIENVQGRIYDFAAYPRLIGKSALNWLLNTFDSQKQWRELWRKSAGWKWASWCTEGAVDAWRAVGVDLAPHTRNPTPLHMERAEWRGLIIRVLDGEKMPQ